MKGGGAERCLVKKGACYKTCSLSLSLETHMEKKANFLNSSSEFHAYAGVYMDSMVSKHSAMVSIVSPWSLAALVSRQHREYQVCNVPGSWVYKLLMALKWPLLTPSCKLFTLLSIRDLQLIDYSKTADWISSRNKEISEDSPYTNIVYYFLVVHFSQEVLTAIIKTHHCHTLKHSGIRVRQIQSSVSLMSAWCIQQVPGRHEASLKQQNTQNRTQQNSDNKETK